jgi:hypothetical protein
VLDVGLESTRQKAHQISDSSGSPFYHLRLDKRISREGLRPSALRQKYRLGIGGGELLLYPLASFASVDNWLNASAQFIESYELFSKAQCCSITPTFFLTGEDRSVIRICTTVV